MAAEKSKVVSSDGWVGNPDMLVEPPEKLSRRFFTFGGFALARRIFFSGFIALSLLFVGALFLSQVQNNIIAEKRENIQVQADLSAQIISFQISQAPNFAAAKADVLTAFVALRPFDSVDAYLFDEAFNQVDRLRANIHNRDDGAILSEEFVFQNQGLVQKIASFFGRFGARLGPKDASDFRAYVAATAFDGNSGLKTATTQNGISLVGAGAPIMYKGDPVGAVVFLVPPGLLERISQTQRNGVLALYLVALVLTAILSHMVARTISDPLHDLASAAELGKSAKLGEEEAARVLVPDLVGRHDAVGRLSAAMGEMINALYDRIDTNERFAADVVHEIKNPLASMRSAVETLRVAKEGRGRVELLDILEHDVKRLDRMVSDISNASRLDAELVNEKTQRFDLTLMLRRIAEFHRMAAEDEGIELIYEEPAKPIYFDGLEERLAQVFVNLVTNAVSFCTEGDAIRVWARIRRNRILIVVEDTGPGIPDEALGKIFKRFYSQRPERAFGNHSGLGLAISKQIVEAHGGVVWAENIRENPNDDATQSLGARFIVGLPR